MSRGTQVLQPAGCIAAARTGLSPPPVGLPRPFPAAMHTHSLPAELRLRQLRCSPTTPNHPKRRLGLGVIPVRSPLLRDSPAAPPKGGLPPCGVRMVLIRSPRGTEMFQFPRFPS